MIKRLKGVPHHSCQGLEEGNSGKLDLWLPTLYLARSEVELGSEGGVNEERVIAKEESYQREYEG